MYVVVDDSFLYILLSLALALFASTGFFIILLLKAPTQVRQLIMIWLKKQTLDVAATDHHSFKFLGWKNREEGQLERKEKGILQTKVIPRGNPIASDIYHLDGTGIPAVLSYEGKTVATSPDALLAMKIAETSDKNELPEEIQKIAAEKHITIRRWKKERDGDGHERKIAQTLKTTLFALNPLLLKRYCRDFFDMNQFTHMREESYMDGKAAGLGMRRKGIGGKGLILIAVVLILGAIAAFFLLGSGVIK